MIHRPHFYDLFNGIVATVFANYSHFWIEHLWGHHKHVATDEDPASSALGDDLYTFLVKDLYLSFNVRIRLKEGGRERERERERERARRKTQI